MDNKNQRDELKSKIADAKLELEKLEKAIDDAPEARGAKHCKCDNPGCSGSEPVTYAAAVGGAFLGGITS